MNLSNSLCI